MSTQQMSGSNKSGVKRSQAWALAAALLVCGQAAAQSASAPKAEDAFWYAQAQGSVLESIHSSFKASLGAPVNMTGRQTLDDGRAFSLAVGRQFTYRQDNGEEMPLRVEFESWSGRYDRTSLSLGMLAAKPNDTVKAQVQFLNAAVRLGASDEKVAGTNSPVDQFWLKLGVGHGTVKYADASAASGCSCLGAAKGSGMAQQLQVSYERHLSADTVVFGQLGRVWLPSASSAVVAGAQSHHAKLTVNAASLGVRYAFR